MFVVVAALGQKVNDLSFGELIYFVKRQSEGFGSQQKKRRG